MRIDNLKCLLMFPLATDVAMVSINRKSYGGHLGGLIFAVGCAIQLYRNQWAGSFLCGLPILLFHFRRRTSPRVYCRLSDVQFVMPFTIP